MEIKNVMASSLLVYLFSIHMLSSIYYACNSFQKMHYVTRKT